MEKAAENSIGGNLGAAGMGIGVGAAMMNQVGNVFSKTSLILTKLRRDTPPPLPGAQYHIIKNGNSDGPHSLSDLNLMASSKAINKDTMVWKKGMAGWAAAASVAELTDIFDNEPPPIA
jgi:hypothetical protein